MPPKKKVKAKRKLKRKAVKKTADTGSEAQEDNWRGDVQMQDTIDELPQKRAPKKKLAKRKRRLKAKKSIKVRVVEGDSKPVAEKHEPLVYREKADPDDYQKNLEAALGPAADSFDFVKLCLSDTDLMSTMKEFVGDVQTGPPMEWNDFVEAAQTILTDVWFDGSASDTNRWMEFGERTFPGSTLKEIQKSVESGMRHGGEEGFIEVEEDVYDVFTNNKTSRGHPYWQVEGDESCNGPVAEDKKVELAELFYQQQGLGFHFADETDHVTYDCGYGLVNYDGRGLIFNQTGLIWA